jgi:hypothetical protein
MGLGMRVVIPPVFTAKTDYRTIPEHRSEKILQDPEINHANPVISCESWPKMTSRSHIAAWLIFIALTAIYLAFPTHLYYWDGITFAQEIESATLLSPSLVHPNHLIYNFTGYLFYKLLRTLGADVSAHTALQILNSLLSALCGGVFFWILRNTLRSFYLSICLTALFAFSATWWKFSTDANAYIPSVLFLLFSFYLVLPGRKPRPLSTALLFFVAMAFHELAVLMFPVLALGIYLQDGPITLTRRALNVVYFAVIATVLIVAAYAWLFYLASGTFELAKVIRWAASYSSDADTNDGLWSDLEYSLRGHVRLFFGGRFDELKGRVNLLVIVLALGLVGNVLFFIFEVLRSLRKPIRLRLEAQQKTVLLLSLLWTVVYVLFLFFWLPQNTFYRLFYLPALLLLLGLTLASAKTESRALAAFVIAVALANSLFVIY